VLSIVTLDCQRDSLEATRAYFYVNVVEQVKTTVNFRHNSDKNEMLKELLDLKVSKPKG